MDHYTTPQFHLQTIIFSFSLVHTQNQIKSISVYLLM